MSPSREQLWKTAKAAFDRYGEMTAESVIAHRSPDCVHRLLPASAGIPDRSNREYSDFVMELKKTVSGLRLVVRDDVFEPVVDETRRVVLAYVRSAGDSTHGPCDTEYFMALTMSEDGSQIVEFVEFVDTAFTMAFIRKAGLTV